MDKALILGVCNKEPLSIEEEKVATPEQLFEHNQRYAMKLAMKFINTLHYVSKDDKKFIVNEALVGLWRCAKTYDHKLSNTNFVCFAHPAIMHHLYGGLRMIKKATDKVVGELPEGCKAEDMTIFDWMELNKVDKDKRATHIDDNFIKEDYLMKAVSRAGLSKKEKRILFKRYNIGEYTGYKTLGDVAEDEGVSKQRVGQVVDSAIKKIRDVIEIQDL